MAIADHGLQTGDTGMASIGALAFGPDDVLFAADYQGARVVALDVADPSTAAATDPLDLTDLDGALAAYLGCERADVALRDLAVHPRTGNVYLSVMRGSGTAGQPVLVRLDRADGSLSDVPLDAVAHATAELADAPAVDDELKDVWLGEGEGREYNGRVIRATRVPARLSAITDLAYVDGAVLVAGLSDEEFASTLRRIPYPFDGRQAASGLEIFHVSHGAWETAAPIRRFVPHSGGILASYTCTPLVHFPMADLAAGGRVTGRTVAELGWGNQPLGMVAFEQDGAEQLLVSHTAYPLMKIACADIDRQEALTEPKEPLGVPRTEEDVLGVSLMAALDDQHVLVVQADDAGVRSLRSLKTASL
ncbi:hypothetical protein [Blastococcus sp. URHD0036]|uniref:hypothetical protein n=1 Tax=Blastococcus sp. URHD0036 TaxID=1380356 RepID=UPI000A934EBD|nr:hypothetical protein [Blastococcus sp. URHD0036]